MKINYYKELDGIRGIAALMIIVFHFFQGQSGTGALFHIIQKVSVFGQTGVSLFFVLSGFLITRILLSTKEQSDYFTKFYIRRSLRIFPLYYLFLLLYYFVINPLLYNMPILSFDHQIYYWVYLQDFADTFNWKTDGPFHFWSLAVEEHFYLFWPFLIRYFNNRQIVISTIAIIVIAFLTRVILINGHHEVFYFTFSRMDELAVGALLAIWEINKKPNSKSAINFLYLFTIIIIPTACIWVFFAGSNSMILQLFKFLLLSFAYFSFLGFVININKTHFIKKILTGSPLLYTGKISYGLYVYHPICFGLFTVLFKNNSMIVNFIGGVVMSYLIATLSYVLFESKLLKLKKYFDYNKLITSKIVVN